MRGSLMGILASLAVTLGIAGSSHASATVGLLWANSGTSHTTVAASSSVTLNIVLTAGPEGARRAGITVDYGVARSALSVVGITNNPNMPSPSAMLPLVLGNTIDTGRRVQNLTAEVFPPFVRTGLTSGQSWLIGTVTFVTTAGDAGQFTLSSTMTGIDDILDLAGSSISGSTTFQSAVVNIVPEPGTVALLGLGLVGLSILARRRS